jgi:lipopolysaccharide/colanic/teichoic acid biosynthesis glycosyltransferase
MEVVRSRLGLPAPVENPWADAASPPQSDKPTPPGRIHVVVADQASIGARGLAGIAYRALEILIALIGLILLLPLILIAALAVRLESPGPALFRHRRPARSVPVRGRNLQGRSELIPPPGGFRPDAHYYVPNYFTLVKLRTMYVDARARFPAYYAYKFSRENFHSQYPTIQDDPRVTRAGRLLRRLSVDELPNLWSVVTGELALVGPRPEAPEVLQYYTAEEMVKFTAKPGITGLAQISGRGLLNWGETITLDLEYVRTNSVCMDLRITMLTISRVLTRHGAF